MTALLNRFAWGISVSIALFASYFVDRNALFDDDGLIAFIVVLLLLKFLVFSKKWIHRRLEYFVDTIKEELEGQKKQVKKEKISQNVVTSEMEEESREILGEGDILP
ncbi:MAG: hypothetical protein H6767_09125 [Candidatus Peribacteria bacterium]|nr:MAG: hypothetical protein H6767_09125 [Candidatus Peribacteria bacterium]